MNVIFFCHDDFACNSMGHIAGFANALASMSHSCAVAIPGDDRTTASTLGADIAFRSAIFSDAWERPRTLFPNQQAADILHVWTPREHVRRAAELTRVHTPAARLVVHLEDNEEHLMATFSGMDFAELRELPDAEIAELLPPHLAHPRDYGRFLGSASGVTGIIASLADFVPADVPFLELWPAVDFERFRSCPTDFKLRDSIGIGSQERIIFYPGSSHFANAAEMEQLYRAIFLLNDRGVACRLVRTGRDTPEFTARFDPARLRKDVVHLGFVERTRLPGLMRLADVLVQPGRDDAFNRYRLPSKLPEFLASGRPVLLPRSNVGLRLRADEDAVILQTGDAMEIATQCERVFNDLPLAQRLAVGGAAFARRHFDPAKNAGELAKFYERL